MTRMAHLAQDENALIVQLSEKASRDADVLKTLTTLALFYLPASFVSVRKRFLGAMKFLNPNAEHLAKPDTFYWLMTFIVYDEYGIYHSE